MTNRPYHDRHLEGVMGKRATIYVRVSTDKQTVENQVRELRWIAERRGWDVVERYIAMLAYRAAKAAMTGAASVRCLGMRSAVASTL
jgi:hypothetical protein